MPNTTVNGRPVYKQSRGSNYVYYWVIHEAIRTIGHCHHFSYSQIFDEGRHDDGHNWLVR